MRAADPLSILDQSEDNLQETIGWFRHAEIKHGRVAMAAFVGYCVQANGVYFPWKLTGGPNPVMHADISAAGSPADQWDALPFEAKCQIIGARPRLNPSPSPSPSPRPALTLTLILTRRHRHLRADRRVLGDSPDERREALRARRQARLLPAL